MLVVIVGRIWKLPSLCILESHQITLAADKLNVKPVSGEARSSPGSHPHPSPYKQSLISIARYSHDHVCSITCVPDNMHVFSVKYCFQFSIFCLLPMDHLGESVGDWSLASYDAAWAVQYYPLSNNFLAPTSTCLQIDFTWLAVSHILLLLPLSIYRCHAVIEQ